MFRFLGCGKAIPPSGKHKDVAVSAYAPFRHRAFALMWTAALVANIGTWLRDVANAWTMTELSPSPVMIALVQAAATLPVFLLSLPAGALADLLDRRKLLIGIQVFLIFVSASLAAVAATGAMTPTILLVLTAAGGAGAALMGPPWQAIVPELVPANELKPAVALNSLGINFARAIGPAVGGVLLSVAGTVVCYLADAGSYLFVIAALLLWKRPVDAQRRTDETIAPAIVTAIRFALNDGGLLKTLFRAAAFFIPAAAYWALLPLLVRDTLAGGPDVYGLMLTAIGGGAIAGALLLPSMSRWLQPGLFVLLGSTATSLAMGILAFTTSAIVALAALFIAGLAWIFVLTALNVSAQLQLPGWVRGRGLAIYLTTFFGAMTLGSAIWGQVASEIGVAATLKVAALVACLTGLLAAFVRLPTATLDLTPAGTWPIAEGVTRDLHGPVRVEISYRVPLSDQPAFLAALRQFRKVRRRHGAIRWSAYQDAEDHELIVECFLSSSAADHLRSHDRLTKADAELQARLRAFHVGPGPTVRHFVTPSGPRRE